jgi:hypothetical protein
LPWTSRLKRSKYCASSKSCICVKLWTTRPVTRTNNLHAEPECVGVCYCTIVGLITYRLAANSTVFCKQYINWNVNHHEFWRIGNIKTSVVRLSTAYLAEHEDSCSFISFVITVL